MIKKNRVGSFLFILCLCFSFLCAEEEILELVKAGDLDQVKHFIEKEPELLNTKTSDKSSLLTLAASEGHTDIAEFLISKGISVNQKNNQGITALHFAAIVGHNAIVNLLLEHQADINCVERSNMTPLHLAVLTGKENTVSLLLENGADPDLKNGRGWTPLHLGTSNGRIQIVEILVNAGADINTKANDQRSPLQDAVKGGFLELVNLLIYNKADFYVIDPHYGMSVLHEAALNGYPEVIKVLLEKGMDVDLLDRRGKSPIYYAIKYGHQKAAEILKASSTEPFKIIKIEDTRSILNKKLEKGEANIWYLGHSGWAIKTQNYFLIFDYWETGSLPHDAGLANGFILPEEIKDQKNIFVFVTHAHGDHYDKKILEWEKAIPGITYIWGWPNKEGKKYIFMEQKREKKEISGMKLYSICHQFDGIPESAFLIELDDLKIFHSGDHGNGPPPLKKAFKDNIDYLAGITKDIDIIFLPLWGEEFYPIQTLQPKVMFPMHDGGSEHRYAKWAEGAIKKYKNTQIDFAEFPGARFHYKNGKISSIKEEEN